MIKYITQKLSYILIITFVLSFTISSYAKRRDKPGTIDSAATFIISEMKDKDKLTIKQTSPDKLIMYHHGWGTGIRNELGLWGKNNNLLTDCGNVHPDECSMKIIYRIWQILQDDPSKHQFKIDYGRTFHYALNELKKYSKETNRPINFIDKPQIDSIEDNNSYSFFKIAEFHALNCNKDSVKVLYITFKHSKKDSYIDIKFILNENNNIEEVIEPGFTITHPNSVINNIIQRGVYSNCNE